MHLLYIVKQDRGETFRKILTEQQKEHEVEIVELPDEPDYDMILKKIESCDKVISL